MNIGTQKNLSKFLIDTAGSKFTVQAFSGGLLSSFGHNPIIAIRDFDAQIRADRDTLENAHVRVEVRTKRMDVMDQMKSEDRKKLEQEMYTTLLNVNQFPTATFESTQIFVQKRSGDSLAVHVAGELSFHGVTRAFPIDALVTKIGTMLRISGHGVLRQSDFGIRPVSFAGGALKLKDELKFNLELVAREQERREENYPA
ncbi:MAG TPA: YceI family protein [Candidatus Acidoferrales bacterium]|jgi:polyisoprenoid-binding protein YceI|nr:YceI family protein [Candidatus Acidoferrales bacterium]